MTDTSEAQEAVEETAPEAKPYESEGARYIRVRAEAKAAAAITMEAEAKAALKAKNKRLRHQTNTIDGQAEFYAEAKKVEAAINAKTADTEEA